LENELIPPSCFGKERGEMLPFTNFPSKPSQASIQSQRQLPQSASSCDTAHFLQMMLNYECAVPFGWG
jgi:hypothetical protein